MFLKACKHLKDGQRKKKKKKKIMIMIISNLFFAVKEVYKNRARVGICCVTDVFIDPFL